jgi:hypothetical protein
VCAHTTTWAALMWCSPRTCAGPWLPCTARYIKCLQRWCVQAPAAPDRQVLQGQLASITSSGRTRRIGRRRCSVLLLLLLHAAGRDMGRMVEAVGVAGGCGGFCMAEAAAQLLFALLLGLGAGAGGFKPLWIRAWLGVLRGCGVVCVRGLKGGGGQGAVGDDLIGGD